MKLQRFFNNFDFSKKHLRIFDKEVVNQLRKVLRLKVGEQLFLCDGKGSEALCRISNFKKGVIEVEIGEVSQNQNEPAVHVTLYCSILKRSNFELVVQKATEVGVSEIVPLICKRTVKLKTRKQRLEKIIKEAAEQSGRGVLSKLHEAMTFQESLEHASKNDVNYLFDKDGEHLSLNNEAIQQCNNIGLFIGPEGGWDESEINIAKEKGFKVISLGKLTLRSETAAIVAVYLMSTLK